jgi:hypothetical protein
MVFMFHHVPCSSRDTSIAINLSLTFPAIAVNGMCYVLLIAENLCYVSLVVVYTIW